MPKLEHVRGNISRWLAMDWALDCTERKLTTQTIIEYVAFLLGAGGVSGTLFLFHKGRRFNVKITVNEVESE